MLYYMSNCEMAQAVLCHGVLGWNHSEDQDTALNMDKQSMARKSYTEESAEIILVRNKLRE